MIQRIQSVYLLLVAILMGVTAVSPLFLLGTESGDSIAFYSTGMFYVDIYSLGIMFQDVDVLETIKCTYGVVSMAVLAALSALINIFLFKKRKAQIKLGHITTLLILFFYVTTGVYFYSVGNRMGLSIESVLYGIILPVIALIFNLLAIRGIKKDEKLVRSLDRIR